MSRARVLAIVGSKVRIRFCTTAEGLADRAIALAHTARQAPAEFAARLSLDDLYLATACAEGDERAWAECESSHFAFMRDFARRFLPDAAARDLADHVIADLWQRRTIGRYEGRSTLRTWLGTVVANAAINAGKSGRPSVAIDAQRTTRTTRLAPEPSVSSEPERVESERALADLVARSLAALPAEEKLLVQLHYEQGLTLDEMEVALGSSRATLSRRLKRVREKLKKTIDGLARDAFGTSAEALRERLELDRLELDLSAILRTASAVEAPRRGAV